LLCCFFKFLGNTTKNAAAFCSTKNTSVHRVLVCVLWSSPAIGIPVISDKYGKMAKEQKEKDDASVICQTPKHFFHNASRESTGSQFSVFYQNTQQSAYPQPY